jgi:hypothetical protein
MPSDPPPARVLRTPATDFAQRTIPVTRQPQRAWFRVHPVGAPAVQFGVRCHHRFSHPDSPQGLLYLGSSLSTCLWEVFGDDVFNGQWVISAAKWAGCGASQVTVPELRVCAVTLERTRDAMNVDKASLMAADLRVPQAWGPAVQQHPAAFEALKFSSRFLDQPCLVLFDRGGLPARLRVQALGVLSDLEAAVDWLDERKVALV